MNLKTLVLLLPLLGTIIGCQRYSSVITFNEANDPLDSVGNEYSSWDSVKNGLNAAWGDINFQYSRSQLPKNVVNAKHVLTAWKGERVSAQLLLWNSDSTSGVKCSFDKFISKDSQLKADIANARFVRYTLADQNVPRFKKGGPQILAADMLDSLACFDIAPHTTRPVWVTVDVPEDASPGVYSTSVHITHQGRGMISLPLELNVVDHKLPTSTSWKFHLDLWQHPAALARAEGLDVWSEDHFKALKKAMTRLARAGQKVITATLNKDPWNHQCYDLYEDMIKWTLRKDGSWSYDYTIFDKWVELMMSVGINKMINCYSILPWNNEIHYMDESKGQVINLSAEPGKPEFTKIWKPFLLDFKEHLLSKGWLAITNIAMDERSPKAMDAAVKVLNECVPDMGFAIADNHKAYKRYTMMRDICVAQKHKVDHEDIVTRRKLGYNTTFYVCCNPHFPNTFTFSNPFEAELLGWYAVASDYDGMLRWAYNSWPENPEYDSRFGGWSSGDTFLVYPYNRSSIRFERLIDGIEVFEKIRMLREKGVDLSELDKVLEEMNQMNINDSKLPWDEFVNKANNVLNSL